MADNPVQELGGKTPMEYARIPNIDALTAKGILGSVLTVPEGLPAGSDTAILSIFGCDPNECYTGRAPLEAAASGIALEPGDVAYRCNMVTYEDTDAPLPEKKILSHSAGSIEGEDSIAIINALFNDPRFKAEAEKAGISIKPSASFRHMMVQRAADINGIVLTPPHDHLGEKVGDFLPSGCDNAKILRDLMELGHRILDKHPLNQIRRAQGKMPANGIWFWAEGTAVKLPNFYESYGMKGGVISAVPLCHGIAALTGLEMVTVQGATGELETNYQGKVDAAAQLLASGADFAAVHVEAPDECTHNGDLKGKLQAIEWLDSRVVAPLTGKLEAAGEDYRLLLLSDHKTLTSTRGHDGEPVPFLLYDSTRDSGGGLAYNERNGERGSYVGRGTELMGMLFGKIKI